MPEIVDLANLKKPADTSADAYNKMSDEEKSKVDEIAARAEAEHPTITHKVDTAFLVSITSDGQVRVDADVNHLNVDRKRMPTPDDITSAAAIVQRDIQSQLTAQQVLMGMQQVAQQQMQQMQNQQIVHNLNL